MISDLWVLNSRDKKLKYKDLNNKTKNYNRNENLTLN